jgi:hypothetical protein
MENVVTLQQFVGNVVGSSTSKIEYPRDEIRVNGARIGFVDHKPNSPVCFVRVLTPNTRKEIRDKVAAIRRECGGPPVAELTSQPPGADAIRGYLDKLKAKAGIPAKKAEDDDE